MWAGMMEHSLVQLGVLISHSHERAQRLSGTRDRDAAKKMSALMDIVLDQMLKVKDGFERHKELLNELIGSLPKDGEQEG